MKLRKIAKDLARLLERQAVMRLPVPGKNPSEALREVIKAWGIGTSSVSLKYETPLMGAGDTLYVKLGQVYFAVLQNYDACPDGINRFTIVVPLMAKDEKINYIYGFDDIPLELEVSALEKYVNILTDLHNNSYPPPYLSE